MTPFTMKHLIHITLVLSIALLNQQQNGAFGLYIKRQELSAAAAAAAASTAETTPTTAPATNLLNEDISFLEPFNDNERITADLNHYYNTRNRQPSYLVIWPGLRELLLMPADYDEIDANAYKKNEQSISDAIAANKELFNIRFMKKLKLLAQNDLNNADDDDDENKRESMPSMPEIVPTGIKMNNENGPFIDEPVDLDAMAFKHHGIKKNAQWPFENTIVRKAVRKQYMSPCHFKICNMGRKRHARY